MSLLSFVSRAGPSVPRNLLSRVLIPQASGTVDTVRGKKVQAESTPASQPGYITKRKDDKEPSSNKRKKLPQYKTLPPHQLNSELFPPVEELGLPVFEGSIARTANAVGTVVEFHPPKNDPLRIFGLPRNLLLEFRLLSKPYTVIRQATKDALEILENAGQNSSSDARLVLTGRPGSGKSFLLLQVVEHAIQQKWVVIYVPRGVDLVNSTTSYAYDLRTQTYLQPAFAFQTLQRMLTVNEEAFEHISLPQEIVLEKQVIPAGRSLKDTIKVAISEKSRGFGSSPAILEGVMKALEAQTKFPVLLAVDQFQSLYGKTAYRDPHFLPIQSFHLSMPRMIMEFASGKRSFKRGAVIGALCTSQTTNPLPIELRDVLDLPELDKRVISEYDKRNQTMLEYAEGLQKFAVPDKLTLAEAVGVFELWKGRKVFGTDNTYYDETFLGKYTESGGNPREFVWRGLLSNFEP